MRCAIGWKVGADLAAENVLHFRYTGGATGADLAAGAGTIADAIAADSTLHAICGTHVAFESVTLTDLASMAAPSGEGFGSGVGTRTGTPLPSGAAALVNLQIARRYKGGKPRSYMPWLTSADLDTSNHFTTGAAASVVTAYGNMITDITGNSGPVGITAQCNIGFFSGYTLGPAQPGGFRKKIPTPLGTPHNDLITGVMMSLNVGSQRRRNRA